MLVILSMQMCLSLQDRLIKEMYRVLKNLYNQMPEPKAVVAVGACACTGGIFKECYNVLGGVDNVLPVDVYVPGCCARPEAIIDGIVQAMGS